VLERKSPPTFDVLIEIQTRDRLIVHEDVSAAVDSILRARQLQAELRYRNQEGELIYEPHFPELKALNEQRGRDGRVMSDNRSGGKGRSSFANGNGRSPASDPDLPVTRPLGRLEATAEPRVQGMRVYAYGVARNRLQQASRRLHVPLTVVDDVSGADSIVTLKNYYRRRPKLLVDAERRGTPIYVLRANTVSQMESFLGDMFNLDGGATEEGDPFEEAMREARAAILRVQSGTQSVDLLPQDAHIRRIQHQMARKARLESESFGEEPERRVRISRRAG
jgi:hypothetical protein